MKIRGLAFLAVPSLATAACALQVAGPSAPNGLPLFPSPTSGVATPAPTPTASLTPSATPTAAPTTGPSATPTPEWMRYAELVSFAVGDEEGQPVESAVVRIEPFESYPFEATVPVRAGTSEAVHVPLWQPFVFLASRPGWTTRRRLRLFDDRDMSPKEVINFGLLDRVDPWVDSFGNAYFLSDYPEVERIAPAAGTYAAEGSNGGPIVDTPRVAVVLTFSEPFDEATRRRLAAAVRLWPADDDSGNADAIDMSQFADVDEGDGLADHPLDFRPGYISSPTRGAIHMGLDGRARTTWSADGRTLTFAVYRFSVRLGR